MWIQGIKKTRDTEMLCLLVKLDYTCHVLRISLGSLEGQKKPKSEKAC